MTDNPYSQYFSGGAAAPTPQPAAPGGDNPYSRYFSGSPAALADEGPDKYHARAAQVLDEQKALHGGRDISGGGLNTFLHGITAGLGNRVVAGLHAGIDQARAGDGMDRSWDSFKERLAYENALEDEKYRRASAGAGGTIGEFAGSVVSPLNKIVGGTGIVGGALGGAGLGALQSAADTRSVDGTIKGAESGAIGGTIGALVGKAANVLADRYAPKVNVPSLNQIKTAADAHEAAFLGSDVEYSAGGAKQLEKAIQDKLVANRYSPTNYPEIAQGDTLKALHNIVVNTPRPFAPPGERSVLDIRDLSRTIQREQGTVKDSNAARVLSELQGVVRDFPGSVNPANVIKGDSTAAGNAWKATNVERVKQYKLEGLLEAIRSAEERALTTNSGGNTDNAIRQNVRRYLDSRGDWTRDEVAGLRRIMGEGEDQLLRSAGKMAPNGNGMMAALSWLNSLANPMAATMPVAGAAAKHLTVAEQQAAIENAKRLISVGGNAANLPGPGRVQSVVNAIAPRLTGPFAQIFASQLLPAPVRGKQ